MLWAENAVPDVTLRLILDEISGETYRMRKDGTGAGIRILEGLTLIVN